jgi:hypothetical protein
MAFVNYVHICRDAHLDAGQAVNILGSINIVAADEFPTRFAAVLAFGLRGVALEDVHVEIVFQRGSDRDRLVEIDVTLTEAGFHFQRLPVTVGFAQPGDYELVVAIGGRELSQSISVISLGGRESVH